MTILSDFTSYLIFALITQNIIFSRAFGTARIVKIVNNKQMINNYCISIIVISLVSGIISSILNYFVNIPLRYYYVIEPLLYVTVMTVTFIGLRYLLSKSKKEIISSSVAVLGPAVMNTMILGTVLLGARRNLNFFQFLGLSLGTGIGFAAACIVIYFGVQKMEKMDSIPRHFKGLPTQLIYIGIISLAIYGFIGTSIKF